MDGEVLTIRAIFQWPQTSRQLTSKFQ